MSLKWLKEPVKCADFIASLKKVSRHIPVVQIFVHIYYFFRLTKAKNNMEKSLQFCRNIDQEEITNENREIIRNDMEKAADNYVEAREEFNKIDTDFKDMKLYEAFGESAPQAALQICIFIQTGTLGDSKFQQVFTLIGILISFFSLTLGASDLLLKMATKDNKVTFMCPRAELN